MNDRRTFFGQVLAFFAGLKLFGSKTSEAATVRLESDGKAIITPATFVELVQKHLPKDFFSEWAKQIEADPSDATTLVNTFLEMLRDPENHSRRRACAMFSTLMKGRSWAEIQEMLKGSLDANTKAIFQKPQAEHFYKQFKAMVIEQIREYLEQFLASRMKKDDDSESAQASN